MKCKIRVTQIYLLYIPKWEPVAYKDLKMAYYLAATYLMSEGLTPLKSLEEVRVTLDKLKECSLYGTRRPGYPHSDLTIRFTKHDMVEEVCNG